MLKAIRRRGGNCLLYFILGQNVNVLGKLKKIQEKKMIKGKK